MGLNNVVKLLQQSPLLSPSGQLLFLVVVDVFFFGGGGGGAARFSPFACVQVWNFNITIVAISDNYKA